MAAFLRAAHGTETNFALIDPTTGRPDFTAPTYTDFEFESIEWTPEEVVEAREPTRCGPGEMPPAIGEHDDGATRIEIRRGTLKVSIDAQNVGSAGGIATHPHFLQWNTLLEDEGALAAPFDTIVAGPSATRITPTVLGNYAAGYLIAMLEDGRYKSARVTGTAAGDVIFSPGLDAGPSGVARFMRQLYVKTEWSTATMTFRLDGRADSGAGMRIYIAGAKTKTVEYEVDPTGREICTFTMQVAYWQPDHANFNLDCNLAASVTNEVCSTNNTAGGITSTWNGKAGTLVEPAESARVATFDYERWTFKLDVEMSPIECRGNAIGIGGWRVGVGTIETVLPTCAASASFDNDRSNKARRIMMLDAGPYGTGKGHTICVAGAFLKSDPVVYERGEEVWVQKITFGGAPDYVGDDGTFGAAKSADAWLVVGWPT